MPSLAALHPQVVHFVVALILVGVALRWASLAWRMSWLTPAATTLVALGTLASVVAVRSGTDAHGPVEAVPGARAAVVAHETWGERARNVFLLLLAAEAVAAALASRQRPQARNAAIAAAAVGVLAVVVLYRTADLGGQLVYAYGGGVGIRSGDPEDVNRVFIAGAHHQAVQDRASGRPLDAAALSDLVAARFPDDLEVQLGRIESTLVDRGDPQTALNRLNGLSVPQDDARSRIRAGMLRARALVAMNDRSAARQVLETLRTEFPANQRIQEQLAEVSRP
jgi:uncharacterized membrane protein